MAVTACSGTRAGPVAGTTLGSALGSYGPQTNGTLTMPKVKVGHSYRFAFPELSNTSATPVTIVGYRWARVPTGVSVGAVHVYSAVESNGLVLGYRDDDDDNEHLASWHDYVHEPLRIGPHQESALYAMISFTVHAPPEGAFSGCVITYRQGTRLYSQTLHCHDIATALNSAEVGG